MQFALKQTFPAFAFCIPLSCGVVNSNRQITHTSTTQVQGARAVRVHALLGMETWF